MDQPSHPSKHGYAAPRGAWRHKRLCQAQRIERGRYERLLLILAVACVALGLLALAPSANAAPAVRGTSSDLSLVAEIRWGWPEVTDLYLPSQLPEGWRFSQPDDPPFWPDTDYANPGFYYVPMGNPESVCAYSVSYTNGEEAIELSAGYWTASGGSRYFHELAESASPVDTYLEGEQWKTFTYVDGSDDPSHEVLFVEWDGEGKIGHVEIDYRGENSQAAAEAIAKAVVSVAKLSPFSDVSDVGYYSGAVIVLAREGIIQGYPDGTFRPDNPVSRAQLAKMLVGALGLSVGNGVVPCLFSDVPLGPASDPLFPDDFVAVAAANGIVNGYDAKTFGPYRPVTRLQMITMMVRALERLRPGRLEHPPADWSFGYFPEVDDTTHGGNVRMAGFNGLLGNLDPGELAGAATRLEVAQLLWAALGGEMAPLEAGHKSSAGLADVEAELRSQLDPGFSIYLPSRLPEGWAVADISDNPEVNNGGSAWCSYKAVFTDGSSSVTLLATHDLADPGVGWDRPTEIQFEGKDVWLLYMADGGPMAYWFGDWLGDDQPRGWILMGAPWNREDVLALAALMKRVR